MKIGQLIGYHRKNIFIEKSYIKKIVEKEFQDPFLKYENWPYLWINNLKFYTDCFYCIASWEWSN